MCNGNVIVTSDATINAAGGYGIWAFNFGTGNVTVTNEASITASGSPIDTPDGIMDPVGIGAYASDGGNVSITNDGTVTAANGIALQAQATAGGEGTGTATITNNGNVFGQGTSDNPVVQISTDTGAATLNNAGTIAPVSLSASGLAIAENGGPITINNTGTIIGQVVVADAAFNNESSGVWDIGGSSGFGSGSGNTIDNAGLIDAVGTAAITDVVLTTEFTGTIEALAGGALTLFLNTGSWNYGVNEAADGGTIVYNAQSGSGNSGIIDAVNGGTTTINLDGTGGAGTGGNFGTVEALDGTVDITGTNLKNSTAASLGSGATAPNGTPLGNGVIEAISDGTVSIASDVTNASGATIEAISGGTVTIIGDLTNSGLLAVNDGDLLVQGSLDNEGGSISIQGDGTVELGVVINDLTVDFSGTGGTLQLDGTVSGTEAGIDATATGTAAMTITGAGSVTSTGADGIDATSAGGDVTITPAGSVTGAGSGIFATQNGNGNVTISVGSNVAITGTALDGIGAFSFGSGDLSVSTTSGDSIDSGSAGILAADEATTIAASADSSVAVTAAGTIDSGTIAAPDGSPPAGILAGYNSNDEPEPNVAGNVTVTADANITAAAGDGIRAFNFGSGNVTINDDGGTIHTLGDPISGQTSPAEGYGNGLYAFDDGGGSIAVSMASTAVVNSAASGIFASNAATSVQSTSSISVTAAGTINSGTILTPNGSRPAGILAGYNSNSEPESNVAGNVFVTNDANITAAAGDGIRAYNYGTGSVTVTDEANTTIQTTGTNGQYGIEAYSDDGLGSVSVTTSVGDAINSKGAGILAENQATNIPSADQSSVSVTAYGTINSGTQLNTSGSEPAGILAGYNANGNAQPNANGSVTVNDFATNITAAAGDGIRAFNYGNGDVTVNDNFGTGTVASTTVSGVQDGIVAFQNSGGTGDVTVNVGMNAAISTSSASTALYGIGAFSEGVGNITVSMTSAGDSIASGSDGIIAVNSDDPTKPTSNSISVTAAGTINSGPNLDGGGNPPNGVVAGYNPDNNGTVNADVTGSVTIATNDATIKAAAGFGIQGFTFGTGDVSITTDAEFVDHRYGRVY